MKIWRRRERKMEISSSVKIRNNKKISINYLCLSLEKHAKIQSFCCVYVGGASGQRERRSHAKMSSSTAMSIVFNTFGQCALYRSTPFSLGSHDTLFFNLDKLCVTINVYKNQFSIQIALFHSLLCVMCHTKHIPN